MKLVISSPVYQPTCIIPALSGDPFTTPHLKHILHMKMFLYRIQRTFQPEMQRAGQLHIFWSEEFKCSFPPQPHVCVAIAYTVTSSSGSKLISEHISSPQKLLNISAHPYTGLHPQPCWCHMHITLGQVLDNSGMLMTAMRKGQGLSSDGVGAPFW